MREGPLPPWSPVTPPGSDSRTKRSHAVVSESTSGEGPVDAVLDALVEEYTTCLQSGDAPDISEFSRRHPQYADALRRILPAAQAIARLAGSAAPQSTTCHDAPAALEIRELGDFRLLREVGRGGMGIVYEAEQLSLGRRVAVKVLPFAAILDERQLKRFKNEARAAATLDHPHIVPVYSVGMERGVHFFAMRFIEGRSLADVIAELRDGQPPGEAACLRPAAQQTRDSTMKQARGSTAAPRRDDYFRQVARWGIQAAEALEHAHQLGIVHRDIKPANLLLSADGHLWVTDFGLAMTGAESDLTLTGDLLGTARYMSPEQARGDRTILDQRTDIYSLGVTLYEGLTLHAAFTATDRHQLLQQVVSDDPPPAGLRQKNVPIDLETIIFKSMQKAPADRYATAQELADDLGRFLDRQPIRARRVGRRERLARWVRRRQAAIFAVCLVATLAACGLAISVMLVSAERERTRDRERSIEVQRALSRQWESTVQANEYTSRISLAERAWKRSDFKQLGMHLAECLPSATQPDWRGFEWHFLNGMSDAANIEWNRQQGAAYLAQFSPDGRWLATVGEDGTHVWDWPGGRQVAWLTEQRGNIDSAAFSPDGRWLATAGGDRTVRIRSTATWQMAETLKHNGYVRAVSFSPDGRILASAEQHAPPVAEDSPPGEDVIRLWETGGWQITAELRGHTDYIPSLSFGSDGRHLASGGDTTARIWDVATGTQLRALQHPRLVKGVRFCDFRPANSDEESPRTFLITTAIDERLRLWDAKAGSLVVAADTSGPCDTTAYLADSDTLVAASRRGTLQFWHIKDLLTDPRPFDVRRDGASFWSVVASPDGLELATTRTDGVIQRWTLGAPQDRLHVVAEVPFKDDPSLAFIEKGRFVVMAGGPLTLIDTQTGEQRRCAGEATDTWRAIATSKDSRRVAVGDRFGRLRVFDSQSWHVLEDVPIGRGVIEFVRFTSDDRTLFVGCRDGLPIVRVPGEGETFPLKWGDLQVMRDCAISSTGTIAAHNGSHEIAVFDWPSRGLRQALEGRYDSMAVTEDGRLLAAASDTGTIHLRSLPDGVVFPSMIIAHAPIMNLAFSPDGKSLAGVTPSGSVTLWNVSSGREMVALDAYGLQISQLRFSPDGRSLAAVGYRPVANQTPELLLWRGSREGENDSTARATRHGLGVLP